VEEGVGEYRGLAPGTFTYSQEDFNSKKPEELGPFGLRKKPIREGERVEKGGGGLTR